MSADLSAAQQVDAQDGTEAGQILSRARNYGDSYIERLPDFICLQITEQFQGDKKGKRWRQGDTIASKLVFAEGVEKRSLQTINGKYPGPGARRIARRPLSTEGEFGILLANVLGTGSKASFRWSGWEQVAGRRMAVFGYAIDRENSTMKLSSITSAVVPYGGSIYADPDTGKVWRITSETSDIPEELDTESISTVIDYAPVTIGANEYVLPAHASILVTTRSGRIRNDLTFTQFQKFETNSTITFDQGNGNPPASPP